jgi:hypothetical protein
MVGVWDTVGSLGVPFGNIPGISRRTLRFHNTHLSKIVQHSYQALALDEQRRPYWAMLWTNFVPKQPNEADAPQVDGRHVEQRWFAGAHCNVGGVWKILTFGKRYLRWVMSDQVEKQTHWKGKSKIEAGWVETVNERIDLSVFRRCQIHPDYRPDNLIEWTQRKRLDLEAIIASPEKYPQYWSPVEKSGIESSITHANGQVSV